MNLGKQSRKALFLASMDLPMASLAWEQFEPEKVPKWSPQAEFLRDSVKKDAEKFLSKVTILGIEISYDDGATWVDYIPHAGGIALATLVLLHRARLRMKNRKKDKDNEDDENDFLDSQWYNNQVYYMPDIPTPEWEGDQNIPTTNFLTDLNEYREHSFPDIESYEVISSSLKNPKYRNSISLYAALVDLSYSLKKKKEFMDYYNRLIELVGTGSEKIRKYEKMALEMENIDDEA